MSMIRTMKENIHNMNLHYCTQQLCDLISGKVNEYSKSITLAENQIAVHKVDGLFEEILVPNRVYRYWNIYHEHSFEMITLDGHCFDEKQEIYHEGMEPFLEHFTVEDGHIGVLKYGHEIKTILPQPGRYAFWKNVSLNKTVFKQFSFNDGYVSDEAFGFIHTDRAPVYGAENNAGGCFLFGQHCGPGILCDNNQFVKYYEKGEKCLFWNAGLYLPNCGKIFYEVPAIHKQLVMELKEQSMLTKDNACLKINAICNYTIEDYQAFCDCNDCYYCMGRLSNPMGRKDAYEAVMHLYLQFQIALRDYVSKHNLDEVLASRDDMVQAVYDQLKSRENEFGVVIQRICIKDFMFNSAYQEMQNQVLLAEKKAQIKAIERREEVNNNRTLLNTAKLMQENKMMYELRKLEAFEKICHGSKEIRLAMQQFMGDDLK